MTGGRRQPAWDEDGARRALVRRRRRRRIRLVLAWSLLAGLALGVGGGVTLGGSAILGWVRTHTDLLHVRAVNVGETCWVPPWEIANSTRVNPGDDILAVSPGEVKARVERHPRVLRATVRRTWQRKVEVQVEEKPPLALWMGHAPLEVAADGTVLGPPPASGRADWPAPPEGSWRPRGVELPLLTGVRQKKAGAGDRLQDPAARQALAFLTRLRAYGQGGESWISEIWAGSAGNLVVVTLEGGIRVKVGDGRLSRRKLEALQTVLARVRQDASPVEFVDARFRHQVIVRTG